MQEDREPASLDPKSNSKSLIWSVAALLPDGQSGRDWTKEEAITYPERVGPKLESASRGRSR